LTLRAEGKMEYHVLIIGHFNNLNEIEFGNGLKLLPITKSIDVFDLAALGARGFQEWALLEPIIQLCKYEIVSNFDGDLSNGYDLLNRVWLLSQLILHRNINMQCIAYSEEMWSNYSGIHKQSIDKEKVHIGLLDYHREVIAFTKNAKTLIDKEDILWINKKYSIYNTFANKYIKFRIALESASNWRYSNSGRLAVASIWAGIESLFSVNSELVFRISLYIANTLEDTECNRVIKFNETKKLYVMRSKAVHGEEITNKELLETIHNSYNLLKDLIVNIVDNEEMFTEERINKIIFGRNPTPASTL